MIGVSAWVKRDGFAADLPSQVYRPISRAHARRSFSCSPSTASPSDASAPSRMRFGGLDPVRAAYRPTSELVAESALPWSIGSLFLGAFGAVALSVAIATPATALRAERTDRWRVLGSE